MHTIHTANDAYTARAADDTALHTQAAEDDEGEGRTSEDAAVLRNT